MFMSTYVNKILGNKVKNIILKITRFQTSRLRVKPNKKSMENIIKIE